MITLDCTFLKKKERERERERERGRERERERGPREGEKLETILPSFCMTSLRKQILAP